MSENNNGINSENVLSEEEMQEKIVLQHFNNDPDLMEKAAIESWYKMHNLINKIRGENKSIPDPPKTDLILQKDILQKDEQKNDIKEEKTQIIQIEQPTGYMRAPEGLFVWSPDIWGGRPLHCVPHKVLDRENRSSLIIAILVAPAFGRNRNGKVVSLKEGSRICISSGTAWAPIIPMCKGPNGRPVLWIAPITKDEITNKLRIANLGDKLYTYDCADGSKEYAIEILYDPDAKDPTRPRLISLETLENT